VAVEAKFTTTPIIPKGMKILMWFTFWASHVVAPTYSFQDQTLQSHQINQTNQSNDMSVYALTEKDTTTKQQKTYTIRAHHHGIVGRRNHQQCGFVFPIAFT
jgi:hypothetical protein